MSDCSICHDEGEYTNEQGARVYCWCHYGNKERSTDRVDRLDLEARTRQANRVADQLMDAKAGDWKDWKWW